MSSLLCDMRISEPHRFIADEAVISSIEPIPDVEFTIHTGDAGDGSEDCKVVLQVSTVYD